MISAILVLLTLAGVALSIYLVQARRPMNIAAPPEPDALVSANKTIEDMDLPATDGQEPEEATLKARPKLVQPKDSNQPTGPPKGGNLKVQTIPRPASAPEPSGPAPEASPPRTVPEHPPSVFHSQQKGTVKLCGGEPILRCAKINFTHMGFARLLVDILGLDTQENPEDVFSVLESLQIRPKDGWSQSAPNKRITPQEMEEVRCTISLGYEKGFIPVGPSTVVARLNGFCEAWEVSENLPENPGVIRDRHGGLVETGYQGGGDSVTSPPS